MKPEIDHDPRERDRFMRRLTIAVVLIFGTLWADIFWRGTLDWTVVLLAFATGCLVGVYSADGPLFVGKKPPPPPSAPERPWFWTDRN